MRAYLTLALILSVAPHAHAAETPVVTPVTESAEAKAVLIREANSRAAFLRSVRDMTIWDFGIVVVSGAAMDTRWAIAEVTPQNPPTRGTLTGEPLTPQKVEANVSKPVAANGESEWVFEGTVTELIALTAEKEKLQRFLFPLPPRKSAFLYRHHRDISPMYFYGYDPNKETLSGIELDEDYSPFQHPPVDSQKSSYVLCALPETIENAERRKDAWDLNPSPIRAHLISKDMVQWVVPAQSFYAANVGLFYAPNPKRFSLEKLADNQKRLVVLLDSENPFLFAAAVRRLAENGQLESDFIAQRLLKLDKFRQAVLVYSILLNSPEIEGKALVEQMQGTVRDAQNSGQLEGIAIGAECAYRTFKTTRRNRAFTGFGIRGPYPKLRLSTPPVLHLYQPLLYTLSAKHQQLGTSTATDMSLESLFQRTAPLEVPARANFPSAPILVTPEVK